jgi:hypothetical protein
MRKLFATAILLLLMAPAIAIDLREYFPVTDNPATRLNLANGAENTRYTYRNAPAGYLPLYDQFLSLGKPGYHYSWKKEYLINGAWCTKTVAILFMGTDQSVTEVGDWLSQTGCTGNVVFGYKTAAGANTGLLWSGAGGLTATPAIAEMKTATQAAPGAAYATNGYAAYSKTGLIEALPTYTPPYGRNAAGIWGAGNAKTYTDVVHVVMYHGTRTPAPVTQIRCPNSPIAAHGAYYQSFKDYNSYAIELYIAKGIGVIQETTPFIEDGAYWGVTNCNGELFAAAYSWSKFIDD